MAVVVAVVVGVGAFWYYRRSKVEKASDVQQHELLKRSGDDDEDGVGESGGKDA